MCIRGVDELGSSVAWMSSGSQRGVHPKSCHSHGRAAVTLLFGDLNIKTLHINTCNTSYNTIAILK